jgi:hypothetical protein
VEATQQLSPTNQLARYLPYQLLNKLVESKLSTIPPSIVTLSRATIAPGQSDGTFAALAVSATLPAKMPPTRSNVGQCCEQNLDKRDLIALDLPTSRIHAEGFLFQTAGG